MRNVNFKTHCKVLFIEANIFNLQAITSQTA